VRVKDEAVWRLQQAELARTDNPEIGQLFLSILDEWTTLAERLIQQYFNDCSATPSESPLLALRQALPTVEQNHGALSGLWIFEMLLVMDSNWIHGGGLYEALTGFEKAALGDVARSIMREAQQGAETVPTAGDPET